MEWGGELAWSHGCVSLARPRGPGAPPYLDLGALPGVEDAARAEAVVEVRAELVEDRAAVAQGVGGHGVGPLAPAPVATEVGQWGVGAEAQRVLPQLVCGLRAQGWRGHGAAQGARAAPTGRHGGEEAAEAGGRGWRGGALPRGAGGARGGSVQDVLRLRGRGAARQETALGFL